MPEVMEEEEGSLGGMSEADFDDFTEPAWSEDSEWSSGSYCATRRVPPGSKCVPATRSKHRFIDKVYRADLEHKLERQAYEENLRLQLLEASERPTYKVRRGSPEEVQKACGRLYGDAAERKKRKAKAEEELVKREQAAQALTTQKRLQRLRKTMKDAGGSESDSGARFQQMYEEGVAKQQLRRSASGPDLESPIASPGALKETEVAKRLYTDGVRRQLHAMLASEQEEERLSQKLLDDSVHPQGVTSGQVAARFDRLHNEAYERRGRKSERRRVADDQWDVVACSVPPAVMQPLHKQRTNLLYEEAKRKRRDFGLRGALRDKLVDAMLQCNSVHTAANQMPRSEKRMKEIFTRINRPKNVARGTRFKTLCQQRDSSLSPRGSTSSCRSSLIRRQGSSQVRTIDESDIFDELWHNYHSETSGSSGYRGAVALRAALSDDEFSFLVKMGNRAAAERKRRQCSGFAKVPLIPLASQTVAPMSAETFGSEDSEADRFRFSNRSSSVPAAAAGRQSQARFARPSLAFRTPMTEGDGNLMDMTSEEDALQMASLEQKRLSRAKDDDGSASAASEDEELMLDGSAPRRLRRMPSQGRDMDTVTFLESLYGGEEPEYAAVSSSEGESAQAQEARKAFAKRMSMAVRSVGEASMASETTASGPGAPSESAMTSTTSSEQHVRSHQRSRGGWDVARRIAWKRIDSPIGESEKDDDDEDKDADEEIVLEGPLKLTPRRATVLAPAPERNTATSRATARRKTVPMTLEELTILQQKAAEAGRNGGSDTTSSSSEDEMCQKCSSELPRDYKFCNKCGQDRTKPPPEMPNEAPQAWKAMPSISGEFPGGRGGQMAATPTMIKKYVTAVGRTLEASRYLKEPDPHAGTETLVLEPMLEEPIPPRGIFMHEDLAIIHFGKDPDRNLLMCERPIKSKHSVCVRLAAWPKHATTRCVRCHREWEEQAAEMEDEEDAGAEEGSKQQNTTVVKFMVSADVGAKSGATVDSKKGAKGAPQDRRAGTIFRQPSGKAWLMMMEKEARRSCRKALRFALSGKKWDLANAKKALEKHFPNGRSKGVPRKDFIEACRKQLKLSTKDLGDEDLEALVTCTCVRGSSGDAVQFQLLLDFLKDEEEDAVGPTSSKGGMARKSTTRGKSIVLEQEPDEAKTLVRTLEEAKPSSPFGRFEKSTSRPETPLARDGFWCSDAECSPIKEDLDEDGKKLAKAAAKAGAKAKAKAAAKKEDEAEDGGKAKKKGDKAKKKGDKKKPAGKKKKGEADDGAEEDE
eukprot:TRINITY_DN19677_c0_g1_i2.p1 TRINITY_DN19677_c0_g1~~TRINITY_DN19677_c0_g1_i2.p1  ORF type:complete len:1268 (-),score=374.44 TRINITY_DN19677_c0_g1_i2:476-4279(-)